jgi:drug/metabolite transporter (DMT)-like permease
VLVPYALARHRQELRLTFRREALLLAAAGAFLALHFATWILSLGLTSVASSVVLVTMGPLFVGLGSWLFLGERPRRQMALGIAVAAVGSLLISWGDLGKGGGHLLGDVLALAGAVMMAGYLMVGRRLRARCSLVAYATPVYAVAALALVLVCALAGQPLLGHSGTAYGYMLVLGLVPQLVGHSALNWALRHLSATYVAITTLAEPIGASALAYLLLGETVSAHTALGGALILVGIYVASRSEMKPRSNESTDYSD